MKKLYTLLISLIAILCLSSCDDFLDKKPPLELTDGNVLENINDAESFLISCYDGLQKGFEEYYVWDWLIYGDIMADNAYSGGDVPDIIQIDKLIVNSKNTIVQRDWKSLYGGIFRCNVILRNIPKISDTELDQAQENGITRREQILAEAKFLRAYHYFNAVRLWGDIPIINEENGIDKISYPERSSKEDVFTFILNDLKFASERLPKKWANRSESVSRANLGMVDALYAKTYAIKGAPTNVEWAEVEKYCNKVIENGQYKLVDNFDHLFDDEHRNNTEVILVVQYLESSSESNYAPQLLLPPSITGDTWRKYVTPSHDLINAYEDEGDEVRKKGSIIVEDIKNIWMDEYYAVQNGNRWETRELPFPYKMRHANGWQSGDQIYLMRLADIVLLKAEAVNQTKGPTEAMKDPLLKKIRERAGLPPLSASSREQMKELLLKERRLELAFEGHRFYDLQRYGKFEEVMNKLEVDVLVSNKKEKIKYSVKSYMNLMPIPQDERERNQNLSQNPNY